MGGSFSAIAYTEAFSGITSVFLVNIILSILEKNRKKSFSLFRFILFQFLIMPISIPIFWLIASFQ
ncbi:hypothetical protein COU87_03990 [Candidatus Roizmanbacteria bacterium CG10_big_fil_rev_8_21_14_0_10_39_12]|uniref:Uncharacterized protein n=1 Tax=Candidatus Roizmanbacteria bacterium CG10_big_fil_rev_8_21_14_0_10_39_12 TaxID=1974852 RepID=A0A2M8KNQ6_9BACT|nr:MAG: hypothetical protein COU87_03990 [Candidatus Roizmanbacteria bacterium CG10_big_fil_rev_8_21_14_0_10_39_12]